MKSTRDLYFEGHKNRREMHDPRLRAATVAALARLDPIMSINYVEPVVPVPVKEDD
jgi:hypothetical protein